MNASCYIMANHLGLLEPRKESHHSSEGHIAHYPTPDIRQHGDKTNRPVGAVEVVRAVAVRNGRVVGDPKVSHFTALMGLVFSL